MFGYIFLMTLVYCVVSLAFNKRIKAQTNLLLTGERTLTYTEDKYNLNKKPWPTKTRKKH